MRLLTFHDLFDLLLYSLFAVGSVLHVCAFIDAYYLNFKKNLFPIGDSSKALICVTHIQAKFFFSYTLRYGLL